MARNTGTNHHLNEWIADHLAERGYAATLRAFRADVKNDKTSSVDALVDYLLNCITTLNFQSLNDTWNDLDKRLFSRLHADHAKAAVQLETRLLRLFMVTAVLRNNVKKAQECLEYMANSPRLAEDLEMRDWFRIPYVKNPETDSLTAKYCSKFWQDTLSVSLYNFISSVYHTSSSNLQSHRVKAQVSQDSSMADSVVRLRPRKLQDTFGRSGQRELLLQQSNKSSTTVLQEKFNLAIASFNVPLQRHASGDSSSGTVNVAKADPKPQSPVPPPLINPITSPRAIRRTTPTSQPRPRQHSSASESSTLEQVRPSRTGSSNSLSGPLSPRSGLSTTPDRVSQIQTIPHNSSAQNSAEYLFHLVCEEDYGSHDSAVVECMFSACATKVASYDIKGCVKVWKGVPPATKLVSTYQSASRVTCLRWTPGSDDLLVVGDVNGNVGLLDGAHGTLIMEVSIGSTVTTLSLYSDSTDTYVACGSDGTEESQYGIFVIDVATFTIRNELRHASLLTACQFHAKKPLLLCGFNTGEVCEFNPKFQKFSSKLSVHSATVQQVEYLQDEAYCVSAGSDGKLIISHLTLGGRKMAEIFLDTSSPQAAPPFRRTFVLNHDGSLAMVRCDDGVKIFKVTGRLASNFSLEKQSGTVCSVDWSSVRDKSTGIFGYTDGSIRWFRLLHLA
ncbi:putative WD repeat-containing protein 91 [Hypsibius exemplaris]|uniref:WD repeat-containing protein 91 n=1 Tax=Hypsibius exemplaris TaxID=2072580 RepID=A0A1W0X4B8_HYPEX|nr:putative WD repeat-containing protein 91 [Hypsibius exemplaris]